MPGRNHDLAGLGVEEICVLGKALFWFNPCDQAIEGLLGQLIVNQYFPAGDGSESHRICQTVRIQCSHPKFLARFDKGFISDCSRCQNPGDFTSDRSFGFSRNTDLLTDHDGKSCV